MLYKNTTLYLWYYIPLPRNCFIPAESTQKNHIPLTCSFYNPAESPILSPILRSTNKAYAFLP